MNRYNVKNCPCYDTDLLECKCEDMPSITCFGVTSKSCPIKKMIDYFKDKNSKILEIFEVVEVEE